MLPLAHTYISIKVTGKESELLVFGSILPDIAHISAGKVDRVKIHKSPQQFYDFVRLNFPELVDLAIGVKLHSAINRGADYYSDDNEEGFAKIEGRKIAKEAGKLWNVEDEVESIGLAHSFIEAGLDLNLLNFYPEILSLYGKSMEIIDLNKICLCLAGYLKMNKNIVKVELNNFITFLSPENLSSPENMVKKILIPIREMEYGIKADYNQSLKILNLAKDITKNKYLFFLDDVVDKMRVDFGYFGQT